MSALFLASRSPAALIHLRSIASSLATLITDANYAATHTNTRRRLSTGPEPPNNTRSTPTTTSAPPSSSLATHPNTRTPVGSGGGGGGPLTDAVASAIHRLVTLVTQLRHVSANEAYVSKVLQEQIGISPIELDILSFQNPEVFQLSVRQNIEPVVGFLRSQGLTGSALAHIIAQAPGVLSRSVEDDVMPLCNLLKEVVGASKGVGVLLRCPRLLVEIERGRDVEGARGVVGALGGRGATKEEIALFVWRYPDAFADLVLGVRRRSDVDVGGVAQALNGIMTMMTMAQHDDKKQKFVAAERELQRAIQACISSSSSSSSDAAPAAVVSSA